MCLIGAKSSEPTITQGGQLCPIGKYCSRLEVGEQSCADGYYNPNEGQKECLGCPGG